MQDAHNEIVDRQFGPRAQAYVASAAHSSGPDLERLEAIARERPGARVLDLGCGGGHASYRVAPHVGQVVACDLSADMITAVGAEAARRGLANVSTKQAAAEDLPFADGAFDMLVCRLSAHHWQDLDGGLGEARRVLKPGAVAVIIDVVSPAHPACDTHLQAVELLRDPSHVRDYRVEEWCTALARAGFYLERSATHELRMGFASWVERMRTPQHHVDAIRSLQVAASSQVRRAFAIAEDGSFTIRVATFELRPT
ncbi:MAG TPA: class I SAM-dependent methyltransferase [Novosphingobium sp.]|nr:class I SAM-dependent methyltransferase [Novosphingobium sp.]